MLFSVIKVRLFEKSKSFYHKVLKKHKKLIQFVKLLFTFIFCNICSLFSVFSGNAEEFRVAAVNKNGYGEYSYVTPYHVVHGMLSIKKSLTHISGKCVMHQSMYNIFV